MDKFLTGNSIGLLVSKFALLGDEDARAVVEWMTERLYPESLTPDMADDVIKQDTTDTIVYHPEDFQISLIFKNTHIGILLDYIICHIRCQ